ncbi:hypothetical protein [Paraburkholderia sp. HP33-1]|uniref:hypothetical protein n=1 Tax=Paraburkholderia sp. HP33-1 TaxID=2883243 RepID=UPI001F199653|nr:hypothetical protein [Paraburkholderia sp. HP33-1]
MRQHANGRFRTLMILLSSGSLIAGCANIDVKKVDGDLSAVKGQRYYLPKPAIQVVPQTNGTVAVSILYLPDKSHSYAIDAKSWLSAYSLQVLSNPDGTLSGVYYQGDTTAVSQQAATTAGSLATQSANFSLGKAEAQQSNITAAQTAVDTAQAAADAANAALASDKNSVASNPNSVSSTAIAADESAAAQAAAKLAVAKQVLQRASSQVPLPGSTTLTPSAVATTDAAPTPDTTFSGGTWAASTSVSLPNPHPAMLYVLNDTIDPATKKEAVSLKSAVAVFDATGNPVGKDGNLISSLPDFPVAYSGLGSPTVIAPTDPFPAKDHQITLQLSRAIVGIINPRVLTGTPEKIVTLATDPKVMQDYQTLQIDTTGLKAGTYKFAFSANYRLTNNKDNTRLVNLSTTFILQ